MGRIRRMLGLATVAGLVVPPVAAWVAKDRLVSRGDEESPELDLVSIFEGRRMASRARGFRGGSVLAWYSGTELDLRDVEIDPAGARLKARALFSGLQIRVPKDCRVRLDGAMAIAGGIDFRAKEATAGPELVIEPLAVFGGISITTRSPEEETSWAPGTPDLARAEVEAAQLASAEAGASTEEPDAATVDAAEAAEAADDTGALAAGTAEDGLLVEPIPDEASPPEG